MEAASPGPPCPPDLQWRRCCYCRYANLLGPGSGVWTSVTAWCSSGPGTHGYPCIFSVSLSRRSPGPYRCLKKFISMSTTFSFVSWAAQVNHWNSPLYWNGSVSFFCFLNTLFAAKETWCRKSSLDSLHMAPVAKETTEDACRPPCTVLKCSCALGG